MTFADEITGTTHFQVHFSQFEAIGGFHHGVQALIFNIIILVRDQCAPCLCVTASHPSAELVQLCQTEMVRSFDHHDGRVWNIHTDFDHRSGNKNVIFMVFECLKNGVFFKPLHAAVQQGDLEVREYLVLEKFARLDSGASFFFFIVTFLHERIDDEGLMASPCFFADEAVNLFPVDGWNDPCPHRFAPGRHFIDEREVQISIDRERQRTRDRGGSHHQQMRVGSFGTQGRALVNTKAVLFVDNDKLQIFEPDRLFDERVCPDQNPDLTRFQTAADLLLFRFRGSSYHQLHLAGGDRCVFSKTFDEADKIAVMLFRQHTGRCHDGGLSVFLHHEQCGKAGNDGLPGANITLNQPVHRVTGCHVFADVFQCLPLGIGELKRQIGKPAIFELFITDFKRFCAQAVPLLLL